MKKHFIGFVVFAALGVLLFMKGMDLRALGTDVDGDGIGISFLGMEIADRVPESEIPAHAKSFFVISGIITVIGLIFLTLPFVKSRKTA
ncbi:hypothetical protein [Bacillus sp. Marseille-Q3570]|uniref:hypothetical protein n=1 Tax=Bacillus sp. Marseille-Q3570 TaxID=2963522 RepID=UPI0021B79CDC|nr:hypothetical protein [Bacillus sp. Marseille-Q3570]